MEKSDNGLRISYPALTIIGMIFIASISWSIASATARKSDAVSISADHNQIQTNTKVINDEIKPAIKNLQDTKADKDDIGEIRADIRDIKALLIQHMDKK